MIAGVDLQGAKHQSEASYLVAGAEIDREKMLPIRLRVLSKGVRTGYLLAGQSLSGIILKTPVISREQSMEREGTIPTSKMQSIGTR